MAEATPELTPYDTGERLQPCRWHIQPRNLPDPEERDRYGRVDFDNDEGATMVSVHVSKDTDRDGHTLHISGAERSLMVVTDNEGPLIESPSEELQKAVEEAVSRLRTPYEREEAEVFWNAGQALILVPGEEHVRKQQLIVVSANGSALSAKVGSWGNGVRDTRIG